jgi:8-oxo-dGTP diphosphatase
MRAAGGEFLPNDEVDDLKWMTPGEALRVVSYRHDEKVVGGFAALPQPTTTIVLVRHAKAGSRREWTGDDAARPLDGKGREQARRLAELLPWYGPERIVSADKVRCVDTVRPTAEALGLEIEIDPRWSEEEHAKHPDRAAELLRELAEAGKPVIVCSQGGLIPDAVADLAETDGVRLASTSASKGSAWALTFHGRKLVTADHLKPNPAHR